MITKEQYKFLKAFIKLAKESKHKDKQLEFYNREKINIEDFCSLLTKHPELNPAEPFSNKEDDPDSLTESMFINCVIDTYLKQTGLSELIDYYDPKRYGISKNGLKEMHNYRVEHTNKIKLPIIAIIISSISIVIAMLALFFPR